MAKLRQRERLREEGHWIFLGGLVTGVASVILIMILVIIRIVRGG